LPGTARVQGVKTNHLKMGRTTPKSNTKNEHQTSNQSKKLPIKEELLTGVDAEEGHV